VKLEMKWLYKIIIADITKPYRNRDPSIPFWRINMTEVYKPDYQKLWKKVNRNVKGLTNGDVVGLYGIRMFWAIHLSRFDLFKNAIDEHLKEESKNGFPY
jgi:hypothetical protein